MPGTISGIPPMVLGGGIISTVSFVFHMIGFSTTYWYKDGDAHTGLWKSCGKLQGAEICFDIKDAPVHYNQLIAAQVLECLALVAFVAAVSCAFLKMFVLKEQGMLFVVTGLLNWLAGGLALVGVIVFATMSLNGIKLDNSKYHYSFGLCIVGGIGGLFSGLVFFLAWRWVRN